jgi:hypothetical protein
MTGLQLARAFYWAAGETARSFGAPMSSVPFDRIPPRQRDHMVAAMDLALRKIAMEEDQQVRAPGRKPAAKRATGA